MKRKMGTDEDRQQVSGLLKTKKEGWRLERLVALKMGFSPENMLAGISEAIGRDIMTIQRWFKTYREEGLGVVLKRHYKGRTACGLAFRWAPVFDGVLVVR